MTLTQQADHVGWLVDDHRQQARDVATEHTRVQCLQVRNGCELSAKDNLAASVARETDTRLDGDRRYESVETTDAVRADLGRQTEEPQDGGAEDRAVRSRVEKERVSNTPSAYSAVIAPG